MLRIRIQLSPRGSMSDSPQRNCARTITCLREDHNLPALGATGLGTAELLLGANTVPVARTAVRVLPEAQKTKALESSAFAKNSRAFDGRGDRI